jgi:hypothetical protein
MATVLAAQPENGAEARDRQRYLGIKIPPTNIREYHLKAARKFADGLADRLVGTGASRALQVAEPA